MSERSAISENDSRRYVCTRCESIVRARWNGPGSFSVGCDCTTVPVVPQMGQDETPDNWIVERPECCRDKDARKFERIYGERGKDTRCADCGAEYWRNKMVGAPNDDKKLVTDGGVTHESEGYHVITEGTKLRDPTHLKIHESGVVEDVQERGRVGIRWDRAYQNVSVASFIGQLREGRIEVDYGN